MGLRRIDQNNEGGDAMLNGARALLGVVTMGFSVWALADLSAVPSGRYVLEKTHAYITFTYSHLGFSHPHLSFNDFDATLDLDAKHPEKSKVEVVIQANSIDTGVEELDQRLRSAVFFQADKYPEITFESTSVEMTGQNAARVGGNLVIRGITKPITLDVILNQAGPHPMRKVPALGFDATAEVKRSAWGMDYATPFVGDDVTIEISVEFVKAE